MNIGMYLEIEKKYNLNNLKYDEINYWTYNRFRFWNYDICSESLELQEAHDKQQLTLKKMMVLLKYYLIGLRFCQSHDVLILNHQRRVFNKKTYECVYTDNLFEKGYDVQFLEAPYQYSHMKPVASREIQYTDHIIINSEIWCKLYKVVCKRKYNRIIADIEMQIGNAITEMQEVYHWSKTKKEVACTLADTVVRCSYEKKKYRKVLEKINPKLIVEVVHYGRMQMLINEIAKEMGIPTVELQHGTMYREHAAYQYEMGQDIPQLPDKLFTFSDFWKKSISFPIGEDNIIVTGFPNFEKKLERYTDYQREDFRKTIIFISQGTIGLYLSELAANVAKSLSPEKYRVIYKLHPAEYATWKTDLPLLVNANIEVVDNRSIDLYELFAQSDIQIGVYSTAVFEGMGFGLQTFIYNVGHYDIMLPLIEQGYAQLVTSADECVKYIMMEQQEGIDGSFFWKMDAKENIHCEIDKILNESQRK